MIYCDEGKNRMKRDSKRRFMKHLSLQELASKWPSSIVARTEIKNFTGGILTERYCANLDSKNIGIKGRIRIGRKVVYPVEAVIEFLESRSQEIKGHKIPSEGKNENQDHQQRWNQGGRAEQKESDS